MILPFLRFENHMPMETRNKQTGPDLTDLKNSWHDFGKEPNTLRRYCQVAHNIHKC